MGTFIAVVGVIIAIITLKLQFFSKPKEDILLFKTQFRATQSLSLQLQKELGELIYNNNARESYIFPDIKYGTYYDELISSFNENLSDEVFNKLEINSYPKPMIISMTRSLEQQAENLSLMLKQTKMIAKQISEI